MMHFTRDKLKPTIISAEKGLIQLNFGEATTEERLEGLYDIISEILEDIGDKKFKGKFSFDGDKVKITIKSNGETLEKDCQMAGKI